MSEYEKYLDKLEEELKICKDPVRRQYLKQLLFHRHYGQQRKPKQ